MTRLDDTARLLARGRVTPSLVAAELGVSRQYAHQLLTELVMSGQARRVASGLYERDEPARVAAEDDWHDHITGATE